MGKSFPAGIDRAIVDILDGAKDSHSTIGKGGHGPENVAVGVRRDCPILHHDYLVRKISEKGQSNDPRSTGMFTVNSSPDPDTRRRHA